MRNHIQVLSSREVHQGNLVRLREDRVVLPKGTEALYEYVEIKHGSSTLALEDNGDVWLVREWKYAIDRPSLEVVSGGIEPGEDPFDAARRELQEEIGIAAKELIPMGHVDPFTTMLRCPNYLFIAKGLTKVERDPEEAEVMEIVRMPLREAARLVMTGEITHGSSAVLILKAAAIPPATVGLLVNGDNHFIVRGPKPDPTTALALVQHWSMIRIGQTTPPELEPWTISTREFRENLTWATIVPGDSPISQAVRQLLTELKDRGILVS